eukprot:1951365-Rhodomonas_salina.1
MACALLWVVAEGVVVDAVGCRVLGLLLGCCSVLGHSSFRLLVLQQCEFECQTPLHWYTNVLISVGCPAQQRPVLPYIRTLWHATRCPVWAYDAAAASAHASRGAADGQRQSQSERRRGGGGGGGGGRGMFAVCGSGNRVQRPPQSDHKGHVPFCLLAPPPSLPPSLFPTSPPCMPPKSNRAGLLASINSTELVVSCPSFISDAASPCRPPGRV